MDVFLTKDSLFTYEPLRVREAMKTLEKYTNLMQNNNRLFGSGEGKELSGEYKDLSIKRSILINSKAQDVFFNNVALTGSIFSEMGIFNTKIDESNMQYCQFMHNTWKHIEIHSTNLSYSSFYNSTFDNVLFKGSTVSELLFESCEFKNCIFTASMLENAIFIHCTFQNVEFVNTNIEYMELKNCRFENTCFPMSQIAYVFGLLQNINGNENNIRLYTDSKTITLAKYKELLDSLIVYYSSVFEYFPLTNIYLASGLVDQAYICIIKGIKKAISQRNFRMLKFFCKQAKQGSIFPYDKLRELYVLIEKYVSEETLNIYEQRSFVHNIGEIRSILLDSIDDFPTAKIIMQTNIDSSESDKILQFIDYIDSTINDCCSLKVSHIEYRHNSDANFIAYISANYLEIVLTIYILLKLSNNIIDTIQKRIISHQEIVLNRLEIKKRKKDLEKAKSRKENLENNKIRYSLKYIIDNNEINSENINIYLNS